MSPSRAPGPDVISAYHLKQLNPAIIQEIFITPPSQVPFVKVPLEVELGLGVNF